MMKNKNSWFNEVPKSWCVMPLGTQYNVRNVKVNDTDYQALSVAKSSEGVVPQMEQVAKSDAHDDRKLVLVDDFVINSRSDRKMSCGVSKYDGSVSLINIVLSHKGDILPRYSHYLLKNYGFAEEFYRWGHGIVADLWTTRWSDMKSILLPIPPREKQLNIVKYLDNKCCAIDNLISIEEMQIEKLINLKKTEIFKAVSNGLNSSQKKKTNVIPWMETIPSNWKEIKIKFLADENQENSFIDGDWIEAPDICDSGIRYLTTGNVGDGIYKNQGSGFVSEDTFLRLNCKYAFPGDLVISRLNAPYGRSCILGNDYDKFVLAVDNVILRTKENKEFICYVTQCAQYQASVFDLARGTAMKRISRTNLGNIYIPLPPLNEQNEIVSFLNARCKCINSLIDIKINKINKLKEMKKSLIYECVIGKKEVMA